MKTITETRAFVVIHPDHAVLTVTKWAGEELVDTLTASEPNDSLGRLGDIAAKLSPAPAFIEVRTEG